MSIEIERTPIDPALDKHKDRAFPEFIEALVKCPVNSSFVIPHCPSNFRTAIAVLRYAMQRRFIVRREDEHYRVGRVR